jgi:hypothetical protein
MMKWHSSCIIKIKSDTLISFLRKKVSFVPQSRPFSFLSFGKSHSNPLKIIADASCRHRKKHDADRYCARN